MEYQQNKKTIVFTPATLHTIRIIFCVFLLQLIKTILLEKQKNKLFLKLHLLLFFFNFWDH